MDKITIICPCCEATLVVDGSTGAIISHEEKKKKIGTFEELQSEMNKRKELAEQLFAQEQETQKDRERILEEKFQEALKKADKNSTEPFKNALDID
ncbi:MAG: 2-nitropropane dioxygenase [Pyrinomonadaceae bacterium]